jgi:hypothetical protein
MKLLAEFLWANLRGASESTELNYIRILADVLHIKYTVKHIVIVTEVAIFDQ